MEFVPLLALAVMVKKIIDWIRVLMPDQHEAKYLIPAGWLTGIVVTLLFGASEQLSGGIIVWGDLTLAKADIFVQIAYGFAVGAAGGVIHDFVKPSTPPHDAPEVGGVPVPPGPTPPAA